MFGHGRRSQSILVPADKGRADGFVRPSLHDRDVGDTVMRCSNIDLHVDDLASTVGKYFASIRKGDTLTLPHVAVGVITLKILKRALNIAVTIGKLIVEDLFTASSLEPFSGHTWSRRVDESVSSNGGDKANNDGVRFHDIYGDMDEPIVGSEF